MDIANIFETNPKKEEDTKKINSETKKEAMPPTSKNSTVTEKKNHQNNEKDDILKSQTVKLKNKINKQTTDKKNPFSSLWNKITKNIKGKEELNISIEDKEENENDNEGEICKKNTTPALKRRDSFDKNDGESLEGNGGDIPEVDEPVVPLTYKQTEELLKDPKFQKVKQLKESTDLEFSKTVKEKTKGHANIVKSLVSQDKTRFCYDGFDLDLTYITMNIIAMGFPSTSIEGIYRNHMEDVKQFFTIRHPNHYKVYNLCDDKTYAKNCFYKQDTYPFKDHEAPPLNLIRPFCEDAKAFLDEDKSNVIAIHCKAGKGRTGTFICCLLLYMKYFQTAEECLLYYGLMRVGTVKGVTVPSQIRYVHYFESILKNNIPHPISFKTICVKNIKMYTIPKIGKKKCTFTFTIENKDKITKYSDINKKKETYTVTNYDLPLLEFPMSIAGLQVCGDVKFTFYQVLLLKKEKIFKFWFNTNFLPNNGTYEIRKEGIDKACKDKKCKVYKEDFKIEIEFIYI